MKIIAVEEHFDAESLSTYMWKLNNNAMDRYQAGAQYLKKRLDDMNSSGISVQVLSVGMRGLNEIPAADGTAISRDANDEIADVVKNYPGRFAGFAALALQDPAAAAIELERSVNKLGLKGGFINSHTNGKYLDEPEFSPILEAAIDLGVPIYIHPNSPSKDMEKPYLKLPGLLRVVWGFGAETGLHVIRLMGSGIFERYPELKIIIGHMGEAIPFWLWRLDRHWPFGEKYTGKKPSEYMKKNVYITTSGMFWPSLLRFADDALGAERILFGVDYPIEKNDLAIKSVEDADISEHDKEKIFHLNAEALLKI